MGWSLQLPHHQWHHNNRGKWGGVTPPRAGSSRHAGSMRPAFSPQLKEADAAHAPRACRAARELAARLDTFVLWLDRCRPGGAGRVGAGRKNMPAERPQQELRTRRGVAANKRITPTKPATREPGERIGREKRWRKRDDELRRF